MSPAPRDGFDPDERDPWGDDAPQRSHLTYRRAANITPTRPEWLADRYLSKGNVHLLVGRQGLGKSTLSSWVIGQATTGRPWPHDPTQREPVSCAILSLEEPGDRLVARLHATGADLEHVLVLDDMAAFDAEGEPCRRPWRIPGDCSALEAVLRDEGIGLCVIDGLGYSVSGESQSYQAIGSALSALAALAERTGCAILGLTHPPKGGSDPVTAAIGSTAWTAVARVVWVLGVDPEDDTGARRVVRVSKSNFKVPDSGLSFAIGEDDRFECGYVTGLTTSNVTAEELVAASIPAEERSQREEAREMVRSILKAGPMAVADLLKLTSAAGLTVRTVERARKDLGVVAKPRHDGDTGRMVGWMVELPSQSAASPPRSQSGGVGGVGGVVVNRTFSETSPDQSAQSAHCAPMGLADAPPPDDTLFLTDEYPDR